ncbi:cryptochrome/photolyase family protein [Asaia krungthepensis]|uniref:Deoxyribodipyrimidine photolyase n=1 Tax=Asaia krungthepensis NRIC 0535 TaxID=1307925 RepID=A0ABQ0PVP2_9PROT|nr:deoxyribodipyrimidine photo-lyase [Asaia krungthepensis]GBQ82764.1 deoxyribodipyrimidine photolyase [Asaia krungthepensis NRIC 0535]
MTQAPLSLVWFRDDLRLADHPALTAASEKGGKILCVYVLDTSDAIRAPGGAYKWFLHGALEALRDSLREHGGDCLILEGDPVTVIPDLVAHTGARAVFCHHRYQKQARAQDEAVAQKLDALDCAFNRSHGTVLRNPESVTTKTGTPYKIFSAWWKGFQALGTPPSPLPVPGQLKFQDVTLKGKKTLKPCALGKALLPSKPDWGKKMGEYWEHGEDEAAELVHDFAHEALGQYDTGRNDMAAEGSSRLSPYLRLGVLSPRQIWHDCKDKGRTPDRDTYLSELGWRDFSWYTLFHNPELPERNLKPQFDKLSWRRSPKQLLAWQRGQTGIPVVDAGMRQLWETGWMHNRARMIVASFLAKHLLIDWREGESWFWDTLIDADPASNAVNWQWVAGTGIEASPFFRIFNPLRQAAKFDPEGDYIRRWVPELAKLPKESLAAPWEADPETLDKAGIKLGRDYPKPIVSLDEGRDRAMKAYRQTRSS